MAEKVICLRCNEGFDLPALPSGRKSTRKYCPACLSFLSASGAREGASKPHLWDFQSDDRKINKGNGYAWIRVNDTWIPEHRYVMEGILGRPLISGVESVHHVNGIRHDNSEENLELWLGGIRYGQRAADVKCHNCGESYKIK